MDRLSLSREFARRVCVAIAAAFAVFAFLAVTGPAFAQDDEADNQVVIFVLDLSGSMNEPFDDDQSKLDVAKEAFVEAFTNVSPDAQVGLRTYGDQIAATDPANREASCTQDTRLASPIAPLQRQELISQVQSFTALGDTPIGLAIQAASQDIPSGSRGTIVLFSDGRDECFDADLDGDPASGPSYGQDPCAIASDVTSGSAVDRIVTVGFRADAAAETELRCIAEATGGSYTSIETPTDARDALPELLVELSAPREAQRLTGRAIVGTPTRSGAPDLVRLDAAGVDRILYTDTIQMNTRKTYRMAEYGPDGGTFTATVFGLPAEADLTLDMRIFVPSLDQRFFRGEHSDTDAGLPFRPTASIRCTDCRISGGPHEAFFEVVLTSPDADADDEYELEILTEGPGFGGPTTSCSAPQECFYPSALADGRAELAAIEAELSEGSGSLAPQELIDERERLRAENEQKQNALEAANTRSDALEERLKSAPIAGTSWRTPLLLMLLGVGLAAAPVGRLRGGSAADEDDDTEPVDEPVSAAPAMAPEPEAVGEPGSLESVMSSSSGAGPSLDVGPAPAISPALKGSSHDWDAELEAAKAAIAEQRPERSPAAAEAPPSSSPGVDPGVIDAALRAQDEASQDAAAAQQAAEQQALAQQQAAQQSAAQQQAAAQQPAQQAEQQAAAQQQAATAPAAAQAQPAGWYNDPAQAGQYRWWDGTGWTDHTTTGEQS